jgi:deoxyinosine 3'endonuclease (endonuclease V)
VTLIQRQQTNRPNVTPRAILVDGNGIFHERFAGLACFVGVLTQIPTIGVGKTCSSVHGITLSQVNCALEQTLQELSQEIHQNEQLRKQLQQQRGNDKYGIDGGVVFHRRKRHSTSQLHEEQQVSPTSTTATRAHDVTHTTTKLNRGPLVKYLTPTFCKGIAVPLVSPTNGRTLACALVGHAGSSEVKKCKTSNRSSLQGIEDDRHVGDEHDKLAITCGQKSGTKNPIFISVGHNISLQEAVMIATRCCIHARIPEPIRMADAMSREFLRQEQKS